MPNVNPPKSEAFQTGAWYKPTDQQPIALTDSGRVCKWSVIKFEVVKIFKGVLAVRFEDGSFEAIVDPDFSKFKIVPIPRY